VVDGDYRTMLANERTFLGWQGTSLGLICASIAVQSVMAAGRFTIWALVAVALAALGIAAATTGWWRWRQVNRTVRGAHLSRCVSLCDEEAITPI
jgi:putative membrane protein